MLGLASRSCHAFPPSFANPWALPITLERESFTQARGWFFLRELIVRSNVLS
jgi:hypothetical protein